MFTGENGEDPRLGPASRLDQYRMLRCGEVTRPVGPGAEPAAVADDSEDLGPVRRSDRRDSRSTLPLSGATAPGERQAMRVEVVFGTTSSSESRPIRDRIAQPGSIPPSRAARERPRILRSRTRRRHLHHGTRRRDWHIAAAPGDEGVDHFSENVLLRKIAAVRLRIWTSIFATA